MKSITILFFAIITLGFKQSGISQEAAIKIAEIEKDTHIKGRVTNLIKPEEYKVVVYILTDKWYIHPYANLGEGESYARISSEGEWLISTVYRGFSATQLYILVIKEENIKKLPSTIEKPNSPRTIPNYTSKNYTTDELNSNGWFGKL